MSEKNEEKKEEAAASPAGASKKPLLIVGLVALLAGAAVGFLVLPSALGGGKAAEEAPEGEEHAEEEGAEAEGEKHPAEAEDGEGEKHAEAGAEHGEAGGETSGAFADRIVQFEPFVVNVSGESYPRYLKLQVVFEMSSPEAKANLEERMAPVRDLTISLLSSKRLADITDFEGKALLKDDLRQQVDELLGKGSVESVMFTEFVVQ